MLHDDDPLFHAIADSAYGIEAWFGLDGRLRWVNRSIERVTGYTREEVLAAEDPIAMLVYYKDRKFVLDQARRLAAEKPKGSSEVRLQKKDGGLVWAALTWSAFHGNDNTLCGYRVSGIETQARKEAELKLLETVAELRRAQALKDHYLGRSNEERARLEALLHVMRVGVLFMDSHNRVLFCNKPFLRIWGVDESMELTGVRDVVLLSHTAAMRVDDRGYRRRISEVLGTTDITEPLEVELRNGRTLTYLSAPVPGTTPGEFIGRVWIYEDVTDQKRVANRLTQLAERDPLTNLYNRRRFLEEIDRMIADASRRRTKVGLLSIDLDGFKPVNDRFGHQAGDRVLVSIAREVGAVVRRNESFFRIGGDEFSILAPDASESQLIKLAKRVCGSVSGMHFSFEDQDVAVTASVGIAVYPTHAGNPAGLIACADAAMYEAKADGKNTFRAYGEKRAIKPSPGRGS